MGNFWSFWAIYRKESLLSLFTFLERLSLFCLTIHFSFIEQSNSQLVNCFKSKIKSKENNYIYIYINIKFFLEWRNRKKLIDYLTIWLLKRCFSLKRLTLFLLLKLTIQFLCGISWLCFVACADLPRNG